MPSPQVAVFVRDPLWFLKLVAVAVLLAAPLTIGAHVARAKRSTVALTFPLAAAALLAGHYVGSAALSTIGLLLSMAAILAVFFLGVRYLLVTGPVAALLVALATEGLLILGLVIVVAVHLV